MDLVYLSTNCAHSHYHNKPCIRTERTIHPTLYHSLKLLEDFKTFSIYSCTCSFRIHSYTCSFRIHSYTCSFRIYQLIRSTTLSILEDNKRKNKQKNNKGQSSKYEKHTFTHNIPGCLFCISQCLATHTSLI